MCRRMPLRKYRDLQLILRSENEIILHQFVTSKTSLGRGHLMGVSLQSVFSTYHQRSRDLVFSTPFDDVRYLETRNEFDTLVMRCEQGEKAIK